MIVLVWFILGQLWLSLILTHVMYMGMSAKKGLKARAALTAAIIDAALVWSTSLVPYLGAWVYKPTILVLFFVAQEICGFLGVELGDAHG